MFSGKKMKEGTERWFTEEEERPCKKNGIMFQLDGPARRKEWLEVGEQAFATLQLLPCLYRQAEEGSLWEKAPHIASSSPQCSAQVFWFMRPDQLSQPCHVLPSWFLSVKKWTHCVAHIHIQLWVCFCPETCLRSHGIQLVSTGGTAAHWHHWNQPRDCTWHLGDFLGPVAWTSRVHQRGDVKVFPRFWWAFLRDNVSKWSTRQPSMSSCIVVWVLWECICSRINSKYYW